MFHTKGMDSKYKLPDNSLLITQSREIQANKLVPILVDLQCKILSVITSLINLVNTSSLPPSPKSIIFFYNLSIIHQNTHFVSIFIQNVILKLFVIKTALFYTETSFIFTHTSPINKHPFFETLHNLGVFFIQTIGMGSHNDFLFFGFLLLLINLGNQSCYYW